LTNCGRLFTTLRKIPTKGSVRQDRHGPIQCCGPSKLYVFKNKEIRSIKNTTHFRIARSLFVSRLLYCYCSLHVKAYIPVTLVIFYLKTEVMERNLRSFGGTICLCFQGLYCSIIFLNILHHKNPVITYSLLHIQIIFGTFISFPNVKIANM
jgi:hypothetical protein